MRSDIRREIVVGLIALERLRDAVLNRGLVQARIGRIGFPYLAIPVLHLPGVAVVVHVQPGRAGPDVYVWDRGHRRHPTRDVCGAATRLADDVHAGAGE